MISADVLGERARLTPDAPALVVVDPPLRLTYRELDARTVRCALAWRALGLAPGDRVAILAGNRVEYLEAFFAAGKTGTILVPLGTRLTAHELAPILADSGARALFYGGDFAGVIGELRGMAPAVERWIAFDEPLAAGDGRYPELTGAVDVTGFERTRCAPEDLYCLLYTSGTTGRPKGVMVPHRQIAWNGYSTALRLAAARRRRLADLHTALPRRRPDGLPRCRSSPSAAPSSSTAASTPARSGARSRPSAPPWCSACRRSGSCSWRRRSSPPPTCRRSAPSTAAARRSRPGSPRRTRRAAWSSSRASA